ncbi:MAG: OmpA family protein [Candidatus Acidiferrales bacterium]
MQIRQLRLSVAVVLAAAFMLCAGSAFAQDGKLKIRVTPKQAYVFVDGKAIKDGGQTISLSAGKHTVVVVNYGYKISTQDVNIDAGKATSLDVKLDPYGGPVNGPWGRIQFHGAERDAVLLEGKTPDYFVGHVDEFNWDWIWKQELLVAPGTHHITVTRNGTDLWSGTVNVAANQKVIIDLDKNGAQETKPWPRGEKLQAKGALPRFKAGIASATVVIAPVTIGSFTNSNAQINCGQSSTLNWSATDSVRANISGDVGDVAASGSQSVTPHATTTYTLTEVGPGGTATSSTSVNVNTVVQASLAANPAEIKYRKIGDRVKVQDSSTLTWTTSNADNVNIDPIGKVDLNGSQTIQANPKKTDIGPVDETDTYTLNATNVCGGTSTQTAAVHIVGSIEPMPTVVLYSVFYPTDYPDSKHPTTGLLKSQEQNLTDLAAGFKKYEEYDETSKLSVTAYADQRGSKRHNQELSERRVERIKQFLVDQGIAADKIETAAYGDDRNLAKSEVADLEAANPQKPPKRRLANKRADWLAYNRRADIVLLPSGQKSAQYYPHGASDSDTLWQVPKPSVKKVEKEQ